MNAEGRTGLVERSVRHSAARFLLVGVLSIAVDVGSLRVLHGTAGVALLPATVAAFAASTLVNFGLNRNWAFVTGRDGRAHRQFVRFLALVGANLLSTVAIVLGLTAVGLYYLAAKLIATALNAAANYVLYRNWVFS